MRTKSFSDFRRNVEADFDAVVDNNEPLIVTRRGETPFAVIPLSMYESWQDPAKRAAILSKAPLRKAG